MGESFVGVKKDGSVPTADVTEENKASATSADAAINAITLEDVEKPADAKEEIVSIKKTSDGVYLFELSAKGYKSWLKKEWNDGDGTPISIKLSISADGKIIDVLTTAQKETAGLGDACATEDYYSEWRGASDDQIVISTGPIDKENTDIGAIAGATKTSNGYQNAIKAAFAAFKTLTSQVGGN
jgi:Na+-translocating ferredoxin:NAD+ oxidoreductase RnfG subunit